MNCIFQLVQVLCLYRFFPRCTSMESTRSSHSSAPSIHSLPGGALLLKFGSYDLMKGMTINHPEHRVGGQSAMSQRVGEMFEKHQVSFLTSGPVSVFADLPAIGQ